MNICIVTPYYPNKNLKNSGIANHFYDLSYTLSQLGHEVHVLFVTHEDISNEDILTNKSNIYFHVLQITLPGWIKRLFHGKWAQFLLISKIFAVFKVRNRLNQIVNDYSIEIIETTSYDFLCLGYIKQIRRLPVVTRVSTTLKQISAEHYEFSSKAIKIAAWLENLMIRYSDSLVTHTIAHRDLICEDFQIDPKRFKIIPHGIELPQKPIFQEQQKADDNLNILYVGRFECRKGIDILLDAIPYVVEQIDGVHFSLVGKDSQDDYQGLFRKKWGNKFDTHVSFLGTVDKVTLNRLYQICDIFVAPSRYESFGLIYVEAMSYGKPVIGCNTGGIPEVVEDRITGLLAQANNSEDLVEKILELAKDSKLRFQMGKQGRQRVERLFSREQMTKQTLENYREILR